MNKKQMINGLAVLLVLLLISACGTKANTEASESVPSPIGQEESTATNDSVNTEKEILIIIDQTPKPIEGNSFDFQVKQLPEGYSLSEMQWKSDQNQIVNTLQEAVEHGGNGGDGFYISGNGQFSGFMYPDTIKGELGEVTFTFRNEQGKALTWKKEITLK
jgi:hypothetical protein